MGHSTKKSTDASRGNQAAWDIYVCLSTKTNTKKIHHRVYPKQAMAERDAKQRLLTDADYKRHSEEYLLRITWNLRHGVVPAHQKIHLADPERTEASDERFAFGVPPFHEDGSPNPLGIPDNRVIEVNSHALD
jgi:DNA topoisomerase VI subunit B